MSTQQGGTGVCDSPSVLERLACTGTATLMPLSFKARIWLSWPNTFHSNTKALKKTHNRELPLYMIQGEFDTPSSAVEDNCLFHLSYISEMPLVTAVFESKANIRLVCLQPSAVIAGEKFPRPWDVLGLSHPGEQRGLEKSLCEDRWDFCSVICTAC